MRFQNPELLYALFLLIIPIIVHLFRLRRFQKEDFTNVKFLKKVIQETRRSSELKKFLVLCSRLLLLASIILAFAGPYLPSATKSESPEVLVYLDNSYSMQAKSGSQSLLEKAKNDLVKQLRNENRFSVITNNAQYRNLNASGNDLMDISYSNQSANSSFLNLKAQNFFDETEGNKELVIISDFQQKDGLAELENENFDVSRIRLRTPDLLNLSLDSLFVSEESSENIILNVQISANTPTENPTSVSIYNKEQLLGRNAVDLSDTTEKTLQFTIQNEQIENGIVEINDNSLQYDNRLYFSIPEKRPTRVAVISNAEADFLNRIYSEREFETSIFEGNAVDFNQLQNSQLIVLNELPNLPNSLVNNLQNFVNNGASLVIIPPVTAENYQNTIGSFGFNGFNQKITSERLITNIAFDNPLLENVFESRIENFDYPSVNTSYTISGIPILSFQDGRNFLSQNDQTFLFAAALNAENSNFKNSPLIVPVLYEIGLNAFEKTELYYLNTQENFIDLDVGLGKDDVLKLQKGDELLIPRQLNFENRVRLELANLDLDAGTYEVRNENEKISTLSINHSRQESDLNFNNIEGETFTDINQYFTQLKAGARITPLWKWFVIFALIFLAVEMLLLKFLK